MSDWRYAFGERVGDYELGILTDGKDFLFSNTADIDGDGTVYIYGSMADIFNCGEPLCVFDDTDGNWDRLYEHLYRSEHPTERGRLLGLFKAV